MIGKIKLIAYAVLVILAIWFGYAFHSNYSEVTREASQNAANEAGDVAPPTNEPASSANLTASVAGQTNGTNSVANSPGATNEFAQTNATSSTNQVAADDGATNVVETATNPVALVAPASTPTNTANAVSSTNAAKTAKTIKPPPALTAGHRYANQRSTVTSLIALVGALIGLGVLIAYDATQFMGARAVDFLYNDRGEGHREPEYDAAEHTWANGQFLEAIQMMRDYLKKNPREVHVALRIAEIYEKDLKNYLAAVLEYEEVLKKKLRPERWGWAAIHLCNLYSKMGQPAKTMALLERIATECPKTGAAKKARVRLGWPEPDAEAQETPQEDTEPEASSDGSDHGGANKTFEVVDPGDYQYEDEEAEPEPPPPPPEPKSSLPPGFRKKK